MRTARGSQMFGDLRQRQQLLAVLHLCWVSMKQGFIPARCLAGLGVDLRWRWQYTVALACLDAAGLREVYMMTQGARDLVIFSIGLQSAAFWICSITASSYGNPPSSFLEKISSPLIVISKLPCLPTEPDTSASGNSAFTTRASS